jgi:bcr-type benzoyl-CoA reductase subunit B
MSLAAKAKYIFMKDLGAPVMMGLAAAKKKKGRPPHPAFGPPLACADRLKQIMTRHYFLSRFAPGAKKVAWVSSGAPVELLRVFDFYTVYPENHGALCGASKMAPEICAEAEKHGYSPDLCSYARCDLGLFLSGKTPTGKLPKPDLLFASNNICQTVSYWYKELAHAYGIPLIQFDTPFVFRELDASDIDYMVAQLKDMVPDLERISGKKFSQKKFEEILMLGRDSSALWGEVLATMKARPAPMTIFDAFVHLAPIVSLRGLPVAHDYYGILLEELQSRVKNGIGAITNEKRRLMWDNIAIWYKLSAWSRLFAERGCNFVAATYTNAWSETIHNLDETRPWESLARAYSLIILNNHLGHRLDLMSQMIGDYSVDGLVIHSARSCKPYSVGQYDIKRLLSDRLGVPSVIIEADITDSRAFSEEQANTRLEAFFETLGV